MRFSSVQLGVLVLSTASLLGVAAAFPTSLSRVATQVAPSISQEVYFACYLQKSKIGWQSVKTSNETKDGRQLERTESHTYMNLGLIGTDLKVKMNSVTVTEKGRPLTMTFKNDSAGRFQNVSAVFGSNTVEVSVDNNGSKSKEILTIPNGGKIVDDPISEVAAGRLNPGQSSIFWVLDPTTISFIKNTVRNLGPKKVQIKDQMVSATLIEIEDPRVATSVYIGAKGDVLKISSAMGIEMLPVSKAEALIDTSVPGEAKPDLAEITSIKPDVALPDPERIKRLKIKLKTKDLSAIPSDSYQKVTKEGEFWVIDVHPANLKVAKSGLISSAKIQKPDWTKPTLLIPATSPKFVKLAKQIVGTRKDVLGAGLAIRRYVHQIMTPNAGIGVLRDANEVLAAKEGVCRDYAILTCTLSRAAGIPTRLASGLVNFDGNFYYHAWVEVWTGSDWIGLDSVSTNDQISATHIKLSEGNVKTAFNFTILGGATMKILMVQR